MATDSKNYSKYIALKNKGYSGSVDDMFKQHIEAITLSRTGSERDYWVGLYPAGAGMPLNQVMYDYFGSLGYTGSLEERENTYWANVVL